MKRGGVMKEKLGVAMVISVSITVLLLILSLAFPQLFNDTAQSTSFAKGIGSALLCSAVGLIAAFGYNKSNCTDKN